MRPDCTQCNWRIRSTATTDAGSGSSHRCQVMRGSSTTLTNSDKDLRRDMSYVCGTGWQVGCCMSSGVEIRKNWDPRLGSGGKLSIGRSFFCFFYSLLFSSHLHTLLLHWISARYKWRRHGFYHLQISVNGRWSFPVRRIRRKVTLSGTNR